MKTAQTVIKEVVVKYLRPLINSFTVFIKECFDDTPSTGWIQEDPESPEAEIHKDPLSGKLFRHYRNGKMYKYLFPVTSKDCPKESLLVIYECVETGRKYARKWNYFFEMVKYEGNQVPRFEEQK